MNLSRSFLRATFVAPLIGFLCLAAPAEAAPPQPPPAPVVVTPANGSLTNDSTPTFSGTATANVGIFLYIDGMAAGGGTADASGNWSFTPGVALTDGAHTVYATAVSVGGTSPHSNTNTFTVDTTPPPAPTVTAPGDGSTVGSTKPSITGTAEANSTVTVFVDGASIGTTSADAAGAFALTPANALTIGSHTVKARAADAAGNTGVDSATNTFHVVECVNVGDCAAGATSCSAQNTCVYPDDAGVPSDAGADAAVTDDAGTDAAVVDDAGAPVDDAGNPTDDAGSGGGGGGGTSGGGCSCIVAGEPVEATPGAGLFALALGLVVAGRRIRRRR